MEETEGRREAKKEKEATISHRGKMKKVNGVEKYNLDNIIDYEITVCLYIEKRQTR